MVPVERGPGGIAREATQPQDRQQRPDPPAIHPGRGEDPSLAALDRDLSRHRFSPWEPAYLEDRAFYQKGTRARAASPVGAILAPLKRGSRGADVGAWSSPHQAPGRTIRPDTADPILFWMREEIVCQSRCWST